MGLILTNNHVVGRHTPIVVLQDDGEYGSRLIARDPDVDLALLSIEATGLTPLKPAPPSPRLARWSLPLVIPGDSATRSRVELSAPWCSAQNRRGDKLPVIRSDALWRPATPADHWSMPRAKSWASMP